MMTFGGTSRSKVGQVSSGDARLPMVVDPFSRESATREFADLTETLLYNIYILIYHPGAHLVYNDDEWATEHPSKYQ
jgi:hypothetical protein